ncbi:hypothetical protein PLANPX_0444 [Lacipirellula parvula]|uniref:Uncharacterized protein n=1 Tax=Lacipirellula parvula TaxID=2650471 RepID=A0A5K7X4U0_9BACT|nr:hypothetical protein PLANPX_0444 [Lacipirellula parvula]
MLVAQLEKRCHCRCCWRVNGSNKATEVNTIYRFTEAAVKD